jgi:hypothetical protein
MIHITYMVREGKEKGSDIKNRFIDISNELRRDRRNVYSAGLLRSRPTSRVRACALYVLYVLYVLYALYVLGIVGLRGKCILPLWYIG